MLHFNVVCVLLVRSSPPFNPTYIGSLSVYTGTTRIPLVVFTCRTSERGSLLSFRNDGRFPLSLYGHIISFASDKNVAYRMTFFFILIFWKQCLIDIYIGSCVWKQRCGWINPAAHRTTTHTHTHRKRIKSLIVVVSFSSIGLWFFFITFCLFLSFSYMILCVLPFLCCSFFCFRSPASSCFRYRNLFSGSPQGGESLSPRSQVYQAHVVRLIHRRIDPFADQHSRIEWICSWSLALDFLSWFLFDSVYLPTWFTIELFSLSLSLV